MTDPKLSDFYYRVTTLSRAERKVFHRIVREKTNVQIGRELDMPLSTVKAYRDKIIVALGASTALEVIALAKRARLPRVKFTEAALLLALIVAWHLAEPLSLAVVQLT
jgi:DNA-binding NarL/FixJ family response regulator